MDFFDKAVHAAGTLLRGLGSATAGMRDVHWALLCVVVIGLGVLFLRGKSVHGA